MIWKGCLVLSVALCVLCERRPAFSEITVKKHYKSHHSEVSKSDHDTTENHEEYAKSHPSYEFSYKVIDPHTHDKKGQHETRDGDKVTGHYWLIQPDGHKRLVNYKVDDKHGFTVDVNYALHDEHHKDSEHYVHEPLIHDVHEPVHENKDHVKENDHKGDDKPHEDIKEEIKEEKHEEKHEDKEPEKESEEFESKKTDENEEEKKIDEKHDEGDKKEEEEKSDEAPNLHEKVENDNHNEYENKKHKEHNDLWSQIRNWGQLEIEDKHEKEDDIWSLPKINTWRGEIEHKEDMKQEVHKEHDNNEGNVWSWRKSYDVWEVKHQGGEKKEDDDNKDKPIIEEHPEKPPEDDGGKKKDRRRNVGLRDYEYRGQPTYHMPIMKTKPIPYRRRIIVN